MPTEREVRDIVGASYDSTRGWPPERFQHNRPLTITAIPNAYERSNHVVVALNGTPCRGMALVPIDDSGALAIDLLECRQFSEDQTKILRRFVFKVYAEVGGKQFNHWTWSSMFREPVRDAEAPSA
jgi:hypothetical protein